MSITFTKPYLTGKELHNIASAYFGKTLGEGGDFSARCETQLRTLYREARAVVLTQSVGSSFELAADLLALEPGDEIILPSYTYVASANAFARRGAVLRFADIERHGLNISPSEVKALITDRTKAVVVPHYAGVASKVAEIRDIASRHGIEIIEDITQAFLTRHGGRMLGSFGGMACVSFHETEGIHAGEGGALLLNDPRYVDDAEILKYRGTRKTAFAKGESRHYGWERVGGEYCANELTGAFLNAQLEKADEIHSVQQDIWQRYQNDCGSLDTQGILELPEVAEGERPSGNFYLILPEQISRTELLDDLARVGIECRGHFYPLHMTTAGRLHGKSGRSLPVTESMHERVMRLPSYVEITDEEQTRVIKILVRLVENKLSGRPV